MQTNTNPSDPLHRAETLARELHAVAIGRGGPRGLRQVAQELADEIIRHTIPAPELPAFPMPAADETVAVAGDEVTCPHRDPETEEVCGAIMEAHEKVWDYRSAHWGEALDGSLSVHIGEGTWGDGEFVSFECENGHAFAPDWARTDYV